QTRLVKTRRDGRVETCLRLLRVAGCIDGELGNASFAWLRRPTDAEVEAWLPDDKRARDLGGLLEMVRYATGLRCRKDAIHSYFGFEGEFPGGCGSCDREAEPLAWLAAHHAAEQRVDVPREEPRL